MRVYSYDLQLRVLHAVDQGKSRAEIIKTFDVSRATIKRYLKLRRETGEVSPKAIPGCPAKKGAALQAGLLPQLEANPDATLVEHCQFWKATHGIQVSSATMSRAIQHLNWTRPRKRPYVRVSKMKPIALPGGSMLKRWMQATWCSLMNAARTSPELACMLDLRKGNECMEQFRAIDVPT